MIGLDVSRTFGEIAYLEEWPAAGEAGGAATRAELERFAQSLRASDEVVLKATGNAAAIVTAGRIGQSIDRQSAAGPADHAEAQVKTDKIDGDPETQLIRQRLPQIVDARRANADAAPSGGAPLANRQAPDTAEENGICGVLAHLIPHCPQPTCSATRPCKLASSRFRWMNIRLWAAPV